MNLAIDQEFHDLIPPLQSDELLELERSLQKNGCLDALKVWGSTIVDGHNRYEICQRLNIPFQVYEMTFIDRDDAKVWILRNQFARRNLTDAQRAVIALKLEEFIKPKAKDHQRAAGGAVPQKSAKAPIETRKEVAKAAGVSHDTMAKVKLVMQEGSEEQKERMLKGKASINKVYREIVPVAPDEYLPAIKKAFEGITLEMIRTRLEAGQCPCCGGMR